MEYHLGNNWSKGNNSESADCDQTSIGANKASEGVPFEQRSGHYESVIHVNTWEGAS